MEIAYGWKRQPHGYRFETEEYDILQVICVNAGMVRFASGGHDQEVRHGGVLLLRPGSAFALSCEAGSPDGYRGVHAIRKSDVAGGDAGRSLVLRSSPEILQIVALMEAELGAVRRDARAVLDPLARMLLALALRLGREQRRGGGAPVRDQAYWAERVRMRIETHLFTGEAVADVLDGLGLSPRQLVRHFRAETGMTP
ncbi:MAG: helix-turn-helix transcriptional regulator, partial [Planctomycetota bacterium]